jgi:hypothetical protein
MGRQMGESASLTLTQLYEEKSVTVTYHRDDALSALFVPGEYRQDV